MNKEKIQLSGFEKLLARVNEEGEWRQGKYYWIKKRILKKFDPETGELHSVLTADDENKILEVLTTLRPREEKVLKMRFGIGQEEKHTLEETGEKLGISRERVRQMEATALRKLRYPSRKKKLPIITMEEVQKSRQELTQKLAALYREIEEVHKKMWKIEQESINLLERARLSRELREKSSLKILEPKLSTPINELEISLRVRNCLLNAGIKTISELIQKTETQLLRTKNLGHKTLAEIKGVLAEMGLGLGMKI